MNAFRRLYQYTISLLSLLVLTWSIIVLLRVLTSNPAHLSPSEMALGIAFILVSGPVFTGHWLWAQREAHTDEEARESTLRQGFFFVTLTALLLPVVHNALGLLIHLLDTLFGWARYPLFGPGEPITDQGIAILVNLAWVGYFAPRARALDGEHTPLLRRLYRFFWSLYGLGFLVGGVGKTLDALFDAWGGSLHAASDLSTGLALLLVGAGVWGATWRVVQQAAAREADERGSRLRLTLLSLLTLLGLLGTLFALGALLYTLIRALLGSPPEAGWVEALRGPIDWGVPWAGMWLYFRLLLLADLNALPVTAWRHGLQRLLRYLIAAAGLVPCFIGLFGLLTFLVEALAGRAMLFHTDELATAISMVLIGLPLWWYTWRSLTQEAALEGETGEHARRARSRKGYLYLVVFMGTVGSMFSAGALVYHLLEAVFGISPEGLGLRLLHDLADGLLFAALLGYHVRVLRQDARIRAAALRERYSRFPVLILPPDEEPDWAVRLSSELDRRTPDLPVAVHPLSAGAPDETLSAARAIILPGDWADHASEAMMLWLKGFTGHRVVLSPNRDSWVFTTAPASPIQEAQRAAEIIRHLAEGEPPHTPGSMPWYLWLLVGILGIWLLSAVVSLMAATLRF